MPKLSILIATFNAGKTLESCLSSIHSQKFDDYEILIADALSTDSTVSIIEKHLDLIAYWHSKRDSGIYDAWNSLLDKAKGEYICFLGADDLYADSEALQRVFDDLGDRRFDLISSRAILVSSGKQHLFGSAWNYRKIARRITVCHPGLMHHRSLFDKYGKFNTGYRIVGDYEFLLRLPTETTSLHVDSVTVRVADGGVSRLKYMDMLREKRRAQSACERIGKIRAWINYFDKLWRIPIARAIGIPY